MSTPLSRRELLLSAAAAAATLVLPRKGPVDPDLGRLSAWTSALRADGLSKHAVAFGRSAVRAGELAAGTPYKAATLEAYLRAGGSPTRTEPLTLSLTHFDCVTLVESCLAVARVATRDGEATWQRFGREIERMRYRGGKRRAYASRLHYFSEWISDGEARGLVRDIGADLGAVDDVRPLRFMTEHRGSYVALANDAVFREIGAMERRLDGRPRRVVPTDKIAAVSDRIETGDVLAFATAMPGLDVTHAAFAYRGRDGILRVLHAPLSGGLVAVTRTTLPEYVAAIHHSTGILVARPLRG